MYYVGCSSWVSHSMKTSTDKTLDLEVRRPNYIKTYVY
jgi:hypothetical protein